MKKTLLSLLLVSSVISSAHAAYFFKDTAEKFTVAGEKCDMGDIKILGQAELERYEENAAILYLDANHEGDDFQLEYEFIKRFLPSISHDRVGEREVEVKQTWVHQSKSVRSTRKVRVDGKLIETSRYSLEKGENGTLILKDSAFDSTCVLTPVK